MKFLILKVINFLTVIYILTTIGVPSSPGRPESCQVDGQTVLTPLGRWQILQGLAKPDVRYKKRGV
jgi:hypothetical protein